MKIDHEYLKGLLEAFESAENAYTNIAELGQKGFRCGTEEFIFHMQILVDKQYIQGTRDNGYIGCRVKHVGAAEWSQEPLRLTAAGHEYISSLHEPDVWETIRENFKESSLETVKDVAKEMAKNYANKKLKDLVGA